MELTNAYIDSLAPNSAASSNGKSLAKNKFQKLCISNDGTLLFGECQGSGKNPYFCSVDFIDKMKLISRCNCPSRQLPCKHALGLMYAYSNGNVFTSEVIPQDILNKREKSEKKVDTKQEKLQKAKDNADTPPSKSKIAAAIKRIDVQLDGINLAEKLLKDILQIGLSGIDSSMKKMLDTQVDELGNYHINGIQSAFYEILIATSILTNQQGEDYEQAISALLYMSTLLKKSENYLVSKKESNPFDKSVDTSIEEQIGHVWKLEELAQHNQYIENAELIQLSFYNYDNPARSEFVDEGYFLCLNNGNVYKTNVYRPYRAAKYIDEGDSVFEVIQVPMLFIYPGNLNPRIRWDKYTFRSITENDFSNVFQHAKVDFAQSAKLVKNQIKSPLADKNPLMLLKMSDICTGSNQEVNCLHIVDKNGVRQVLDDINCIKLPTVQLMTRIADLKEKCVLVMYENDTERGILAAKPMSIITQNSIIRLLF